MSTAQRSIAEDVLARDRLRVRTEVIQNRPVEAVVGWDDYYALWWVECKACGTGRLFGTHCDTVIRASTRHNSAHHMQVVR